MPKCFNFECFHSVGREWWYYFFTTVRLWADFVMISLFWEAEYVIRIVGSACHLRVYVKISNWVQIHALGENHLYSELFTLCGVMVSFKWLLVIRSGISRMGSNGAYRDSSKHWIQISNIKERSQRTGPRPEGCPTASSQPATCQ